MLDSVTQVFNKFKRDEHKDFFDDYIIGDTTHLVDVARSLYVFSDAKNKIVKKYKSSIDKQVKQEAYKIKKFIINEDYLYTVIEVLMEAEKEDKHRLKNYIDAEIIKKSDNPTYLVKYIKSKESGRQVALALAILDDYMDYLDGKKYNGPTINLNKTIGDNNEES